MSNLLRILGFICAFGICSTNQSHCNVLECLYNINDILKAPEEAEFFCGKLNKTVDCFIECGLKNRSVQNEKFYNGLLTLSSLDICSSISYSITKHGQCISFNMFQMVACFLESANLITTTEYSDPKLLECKKLKESQGCSRTVSSCGESAIEVVDEVLLLILKNATISACEGFSFYDLSLIPPAGNKFKKVAQCLTYNKNHVEKCYMQHFYGMHGENVSPEMICSATTVFYTCLEPEFELACGSEIFESTKDYFRKILTFFGQDSCSPSYQTTDKVTEKIDMSKSKIQFGDSPFNDLISTSSPPLSVQVTEESAFDESAETGSKPNKNAIHNNLEKWLTDTEKDVETTVSIINNDGLSDDMQNTTKILFTSNASILKRSGFYANCILSSVIVCLLCH